MLLTSKTRFGIISSVSNVDFIEWLEAERTARKWSKRELAGRMNISPPQVTRVINREQLPGRDFLQGVARAFGLTDDDIFRRAGYISGRSEYDQITTEIAQHASGLDDYDKGILRDFARLLRTRKAE
mgnify:CR=1 FL=1